jgi:hypothetical protein
MMLGRLARPLRPLLPQQLRTMLDMIPPRVAPDVLAPQVFRAEGAVRKRVALLAGCAQQALNGDINAATIRLLLRHGCEVVKLRQWSSPCVVEELKKAGQLQFFGITPHSPSDRSWRGASFQYPRGFVQFCPVVSNFVHEPSCLIARYAVGSGQVRYLNRWGQAAWPGFALLRHSFSS